MRTPLTYILLAANIAVFGLQLSLGLDNSDPITNYGFTGDEATEEPWRWITSAFIHLDAAHLVVNMASLWALGVSLERYIGTARFGIVYFLGALGGSAAVWQLEDPNVYTVGASGAIFALVGAGIIAHLVNGQMPLYELCVLAVGVVWSFYADNGVSWQAHLGGAILGFALGAVIMGANRLHVRREKTLPDDEDHDSLEHRR